MILHPPVATQVLLRGMEQMAALVRPTLGPVGGTVAIARMSDHCPPELLDSAATIARRVLQLADPAEDVGAMILRHVALRVFERAGDGAATAVVLASALMRAAAPYLAAGYSPIALRRGIECGLEIACAELRRQARTIDLPSEISAVALAAVGDEKLATLIGEAVDSVGVDGAVLFENAVGPETRCEYVDGVRWNEGYLSYFLLKAGESTARLLNPRILATDIALKRADQLVPVLEACIASGDRSLLIIAPEVHDSAVGMLVANRERGVLEEAVAVKAPSFGEVQTRILEDLAAITGGRCLRAQAGDSFAQINSQDLGRARHAWASKYAFGITGGQGDRQRIRERMAQAKAELQAIDDDVHAREKLRERIAKLAGTTAIMHIGAPTPGEQSNLRLRVEAAVTAVRLAVEQGVVAGGGAALLVCVPLLEQLMGSDEDSPGVRIVAQALAEPMRVLLRNAGLEPAPILHEALGRGPGWSFDVLQRGFVETLVDPLSVTLGALEGSVSAASSAITAGVLITRRS
ncbi:MAG: chaperonin GroEL [Chloroflexi bacterium]|nr:chaperonin GroEL [Chloroflexota bacterium]